ncbi:hypothetical protein [Nocardioides plantarum]|uniref:Uncharacterized protein n=1 Tax=Nocardioides plantarum TaxID=29299 RepID=A0ABV5K6R4_9ACTN|nr:hypothetical protein [Nocardioides plantarum]
MTDEHHDDSDDIDDIDRGDDADLRALLRSVDPAASLPQADPTRVARLLEDTMTDDLTDESRADGAHGRSPLTWIVAAAAVLVIGGGVLFATTRGDDEAPPTAGDAPSAPADTDGDPAGSEGGGSPSVTDLTATGGAAAKCRTPESSPDVVASQTTVVDGTVDSVSGSTVTITPTRFYAGEPTDVVVVQAPGPDMEALLSAVRFEEGKRYLVAATDGRVTLCGFSAEYSASLADVYATAFPG